MKNALQIEYLADHPEFIPTLAKWHHDEWAYLRPGDTVEARESRLRKECGRGEVPSVVVAFHEGGLLGSAMLLEHDMETRMDLSPWLAGVFVAPEYRRRGIGAALVQRIVDLSGALGVRRLCLYTPDAERFYSRLGWLVIERTIYHGKNATVMSYAHGR